MKSLSFIFLGIAAIASVIIAFSSVYIATHVDKEEENGTKNETNEPSTSGDDNSQTAEEYKYIREDYYKDVDRKDKDRLFTESRFGNDLGFLMKILFSVQSIGIAALFYKKELNDVSAICLIFLIFSLVSTALAFVFSLVGLSKWSNELTQLNKKYEDMKRPTNFYQHLFICISFVCMLIAFIMPITDFYGKQ